MISISLRNKDLIFTFIALLVLSDVVESQEMPAMGRQGFENFEIRPDFDLEVPVERELGDRILRRDTPVYEGNLGRPTEGLSSELTNNGERLRAYKAWQQRSLETWPSLDGDTLGPLLPALPDWDVAPFRVVPTIGGTREIKRQLVELPEIRRNKIISSLEKSDAVEQRTACDRAAKDLTRKRDEYSGLNLANDFQAVCVGDISKWVRDDVTASQRARSRVCAEAYKSYKTACLNKEQIPLRTNSVVGILSARPSPAYGRQIICTVTFLTKRIVLTAQHCLEPVHKGNPDLVLAVHHAAGNDRALYKGIAVVAAAAAPSFEPTSMEKLKSREIPQKESFEQQHDIVLLVIDRDGARGAHRHRRWNPEIQQLELFEGMALIGYQHLARRSSVLDWLLQTGNYLSDEELLNGGGWQEFVLGEETAHCRAIRPSNVASVDDRAIGHQCQSYHATSGAPLFRIKGKGESSAKYILGGLHTRAARLNDSGEAQVYNEGLILPANLSKAVSKISKLYQ